MNRPPETFIRVDEERLFNFSIACFEKVGITHEHATLISRLLVNSDLRGVRSHGTRAVNGYCAGFENGSLNPHPNVRIINETPTTVVLDGNGTLGYLPMVRATERAITKAKEVGIGMGLVRYIGHYGSAGHYSRLCNEDGCIGFSVQGFQNQGDSGSQNPKPQLGYSGNPPICFAIPSGDEPPVVLDAATCIMADYQRGPEFDALLSIIPAAFFKSIGYTAVASLLGGGLTGFTEPPPEDTAKWSNGRMGGGMILAIHIESVVRSNVFYAEVDRMARDVRETYEPMPGTDRALLPGAIEIERTEQHRREGIRYGEMEQEAAREVSERLGVPLSWDE